jgi:hypothetical protein
MRIAEVIPKEDGTLYIIADDGRAGFLDMRPYLASEAFAPLKSRVQFERIHNGGYFIEWACGADLSADTIEARWEIVPPQSVQQTQLAER